MKLFEKIKIKKEKEINFLNIPIVSYGAKNLAQGYEEFFDIFPKSFEKQALDKIIKLVPEINNHDHIWIVRTVGLGEAHLLNFFIETLNKEYGAKSPCIISQRKIYKEMFKMYNDIPFYGLDMEHDEFAFKLKHRNIKYRKKFFHIYHCTIDESLKWLHAHINGENSHVISSIYKWWNINDEKIKKKNQIFSNELKAFVEKVMSDLKLKDFVFLVPESNGTSEIPVECWAKFSEQMKQKGYDVFVNTKNGVSLYGKSAYLNIAQACYLSTKAKAIVGLRTGLIEILAALEKRGPLHILYTPFRSMEPDKFIKTYTLYRYPFVLNDDIIETKVSHDSHNDVLEAIAERI